ncbi:MAG TPA: ABC transporter permease, partial [Streptomyces sp.]|nr:ABC transporter permease [Streptomyces sp.]
AALAAGLGIWALLARAGVQALPGPVAVGKRAAELIADGTL